MTRDFFACFSEEPSMGETVLMGACARTIVGITLLPVTVLKARFEVITVKTRR